MKTKTQLVCEQCNKKFYPISGSLKQRFCSKKCGYAGRETGGKKGKHYPHLQRAEVRKCLVCGKEFRAVKDFGKRKQKYCSHKCYEVIWKQRIEPNMVRTGATNEKNHSWKGDKVGYHGLHHWIYRNLGAPQKCEICGATKKQKYEWANKDHKYKRNLKDWLRLCTTCHRNYDYKHNLKRNY